MALEAIAHAEASVCDELIAMLNDGYFGDPDAGRSG